MNIKFTYRHTTGTDSSIERHAREQLKKVITFLEHERTPVDIELVFNPSKNHAHHEIELLIKSPHYNVVVSKKEGTEFYELLNQVIDIAYDELHQEKRKLVDSNRQLREDKAPFEK